MNGKRKKALVKEFSKLTNTTLDDRTFRRFKKDWRFNKCLNQKNSSNRATS